METRKAKTTVVVLSAMAVLLVLCSPAVAGDLEPSAAPAPTMKTLDEVEPRIPIQSLSGSSSAVYVITQPGSYYLTGNVDVVSTTKHGIIVECNDVTIDLMGYTLKGPDSGYYSGIHMVKRNNVEIRNGTVRDFYYGIREGNPGSRQHRVINIRAMSNAYNGINLYGDGHLVKGCTAGENGVNGIYVEDGCTVTGNTVLYNDNYGIYARNGCTVTNNTAYGNDYGIFAFLYVLVDQNTAYDNTTKNIHTVTGCVLGVNCAPAP